MNLQPFFSFNISELAIFLLALGYVIVFLRQGGNQGNSELRSMYKDQIELNNNKISELTHEVGILTGQLKDKEVRITVLEGLVKTTPEQTLYMTDMRKFTAGVADYMASSTKTLGEISIYMHNINNKDIKNIIEKVV